MRKLVVGELVGVRPFGADVLTVGKVVAVYPADNEEGRYVASLDFSPQLAGVGLRMAQAGWKVGQDPGKGMTSEQLAIYVGDLIGAVSKRIRGVGAEQYDQGEQGQAFESMDLDELFAAAEEEVEDLMAYAGMLRIRLGRIRGAVATRVVECAKGAA